MRQTSRILQDVARYYEARGQKMWDAADLTIDKLLQSYHESEIFLGFLGASPGLTFVLQEEDPLFWPQACEGEAFYLHKLAIAPSLSARGLGKAAIAWCKDFAREHGNSFLRLDCDPNREKLVAFYKSCGFKPVDRRFVGKYDTLFWEMKISQN